MLLTNQINLKKIFISLFSLFSFYIQAQDSEYIKTLSQKIIVPSPSTFEFSKFGNVPLNGSSGGFNYSIALYTIQSGDITLPISIGYYGAGVQIDALSGITGTNWSLNAGGVISRVVRDYPDESAGIDGRLYFSETFDVQAHADDIKNIARDLNYNSFYDGEQDLFSFNVNGISGSFYFDKNLVPHVSSDQTVKIIFELVNGVSKFTLIDERGYKYLFGGNISSIETTLNYNQCDNAENGSAITGWFLTEIISPTNNSITFTYDQNEHYYSNNLAVSASAQDTCGYEVTTDATGAIVVQPIPLLTTTAISTCLNSNTITSKVLSSISFQNNSVIFSYNSQRQDGGGKSLKDIQILKQTELIKKIEFNYDMFTARSTPLNSIINTVGESGVNFRMFLKDITFKGNLGNTNYEKYSFEYYSPSDLPARLSYSKDKFGYNNGSTNSTPFSNKTLPAVSINNLNVPFPAATANTEVNPDVAYFGMLKKITYPTKGTTEIVYEANKDIKTSEKKVPISYTLGVIKYCDASTAPVTGSFEFVSNGLPINFDAIGNTQGATCSTGTNNKYNIKVYKDNQIILNLDANYGVPLNSDSTKSCLSSWSTTYAKEPICTVSGSTYKITMTLQKGGVYGNVKIQYNGDFVKETVYGGGVRTKEIVDYSNGSSYNKRTFYYNKLVDYLSDDTTMQSNFDPKYNRNSNIVIWCPTYSSGHLPSCSDYTPNLVYSYAISSNPINSSYLTRQPISYSAITEVLDNNGVKNGAIEKIFSPSVNSPARLYNGTDVYSDTADNYGELLKDKIIEENIYNSTNQIKQKKTYGYTIFDNNYLSAIKARKNYLFPLDELGFPGAYTSVCVNPLIWFPNVYNYSVWGYKNYYGIIKLDTTTETIFFTNQSLVTSTINTYSNFPYCQLKSTSVTNSQNQTLKTEFQYSYDLIGVEQTPYMQQLLDENRISEPIVTKTFNTATKLSERHLKYERAASTNNLLLPKEAYTNKGSTNINTNDISDRKLIFDQYDNKGNIMQYTPENGTSISIIWGYNKTQPIAKIENATNAQVAAALGLSSIGIANETNMAAINALRAALPNAMVTTYTYIPLVGVSTITDPKGDTATYTYDSFGKLESVRDSHGFIVSENQYNYKH